MEIISDYMKKKKKKTIQNLKTFFIIKIKLLLLFEMERKAFQMKKKNGRGTNKFWQDSQVLLNWHKKLISIIIFTSSKMLHICNIWAQFYLQAHVGIGSWKGYIYIYIYNFYFYFWKLIVLETRYLLWQNTGFCPNQKRKKKGFLDIIIDLYIGKDHQH